MSSLSQTLVAKPPPIRGVAPGVLRVGETRVSLESVLHLYLEGASPEAIVDAFDVLELADVHAVISHYLSNRKEMDAYLAEAARQEELLEQRVMQQPGYQEWRERIMARQGRARVKHGAVPVRRGLQRGRCARIAAAGQLD